MYKDGTYHDNNPTWDVEDSPWKANHIANILKSNKITPQSIAEVGCGAGAILSELSQTFPNVRCTGYEISPQAHALSKPRASNRVSFLLENIVENNIFYDCLLCIDVFEHVENYMGFIKSLKEQATYKVFHIPLDITVSSVLRSKMMAARKSVGHLHYFTPETAVATLEDCGYEIIDKLYTKPFADLPSKTLRTALAKLPRKILYRLSPTLCVKLLGGCSLLILEK